MSDYRGTEGHRPYAGAGWYYSEYRSRASREFIQQLAVHLGWALSDRILDLGAGPGHLSLLVAPLVSEVIAIEPEPDMLMEGERRVKADGVRNVIYIPASSDDLRTLAASLGLFHTVLMGRSFHWMTERDRVLNDLGALTGVQDGSVAIISPKVVSVPTALEEASQALHRLLEKYIESRPRGPHPSGRHETFEEILGRSPFKHIERLERVYKVKITPTLPALIGNEYSYSYILTRLGDQRPAFEQEANQVLEKQVAEIGEVTVTRRDEALIGRKR